MESETAIQILLFLYWVCQNRTIPVALISEVRQHLTDPETNTHWDEETENTFNSELRYLIGKNYIHQSVQLLSITSDGVDRAREILNPTPDYNAIAIEEAKKSNRMQILNTAITIIIFMLPAIVTVGGMLLAKLNNTSRLFTVNSVIVLSNVVDINSQPVTSTPLSNWFSQTPENVSFSGIPYDLSQTSQVIETELETSPNPNRAFIPVNISKPLRVHLLINMSYGYSQFSGQDVCNVILYFENHQTEVIPLKAGGDIREWVYSSSKVVNTVGDHVQPVWKGIHKTSQMEAAIDHIMLTVPDQLTNEKLVAIEIQDRSQELLQSRDPGIVLFGVTVEYKK